MILTQSLGRTADTKKKERIGQRLSATFSGETECAPVKRAWMSPHGEFKKLWHSRDRERAQRNIDFYRYCSSGGIRRPYLSSPVIALLVNSAMI